MNEPPTFMVGTGRCGSTTLHAFVATHPATAWLASVTLRRPAPAALNRMAVRASSLPWPGDRPPPLTRPTEPYRWWNQFEPEFGSTRRDLVAADVTPEAGEGLRDAVEGMVFGRRRHPLLKITGWPRVEYLREVFPDARFIHLVRDGRAVASSQTLVDWWHGSDGPDHWLQGPLSDDQRARWEAHDRDPLVLAGIGWEIVMDRFAEVRPQVPADDWLEIRYEDLCEHPREALEQITRFMGIGWPERWHDVDLDARFRRSDGWRRRLRPEQQVMLDSALSDALARHGYAAG